MRSYAVNASPDDLGDWFQYEALTARASQLIPMAGTDCHDGQEQSRGGKVENHPKIPPLIYAKLVKSTVERAATKSDTWSALGVWREVLCIDYANKKALTQIQGIVKTR